MPAQDVNPLLDRINAFWDDFLDAPYEQQWTAVTHMLRDEPEICDGEMVFEITNALFPRAVAAGEIERYKHLLAQLEEIVPEAYQAELHYILEWHIQIALIEEDEAGLERYFHQFTPLAGEHLDLYYRLISALTYHGKLEILHEGMRQARPYVAKADGLVEWAYGEFLEKLGDLEVLYLLEQNPNLTADDAILQERFAEYELTLVGDRFATRLDYRTGRKLPDWTLADFEFAKRRKDDPTKIKFSNLLAAFAYYAHAEGAFPLTKIEMACDQLSEYISLRFQGDLGRPGPGQNPRPKRARRKSVTPIRYLFYPDASTLDRYLAKLMGFMSFQHYEAFALFELIPAWLRFLVRYDLLEETTRQQIIDELSYLKKAFIQIAANQLTDPALKENMIKWPTCPNSKR